MNSVGGLRLSEFLVGPSLTHEVALRNQLLAHCATSKSLPLSELLEVLARLSRQEGFSRRSSTSYTKTAL